MGVYLFDPGDPFDTFLLIYIAAQAVNGVGRIYDHPSVPQAFCHLLDQSGLWVIGVHLYQHTTK
jgi:hypothetical protein